MGERRGACRLCWGNLRERDDLQDLDVDGRMILDCLFKKKMGDVDWIDLTHNTDKCRAIMNLLVP
jgi:hypothetical protein